MMIEETIAFIRSLYATDAFIPLHEPRIGDQEKQALADAAESGFVSTAGAYVGQFEEALSSHFGGQHVVAVNSGTSALHMALIGAGVERGDEVITQPLTFVATCNAIAYVGTMPVFTDIAASTLGMCPAALEVYLERTCVKRDGQTFNKGTGARIGACMPMHSFGFPCDMMRIGAVCKEWGIPVIEDAAEALGSRLGGQPCGTLSDVAALSFNGNKLVTAGAGGAVVTSDRDIADRIRHLSTTAKTPHAWRYDHDEIGYNYRMNNLCAAVGVAQLKQLDVFLTKKRDVAKAFQQFFEAQSIQMVWEPEGTHANFWLNCLLLDDETARDSFLEATNAAGIMTRPAWTLMHHLPMFKACETAGPLAVAEDIARRLVNIPSSVPANE